MKELVGQYLERYYIQEKLGEGGMALVYKAHDTRLERTVAVKVIRTEMVPPMMLENMLKRFEREAKSLAKLSHPNIVTIYDFGEYEGSPYLVMEYLPGGTLKQFTGKPLYFVQAARLILPVSRALAYAHDHQMIHRDVKPANILLSARGEVKLSDFGVAKVLASEQVTQITGTGIIGTPEYMAPEQWMGQVTAHTDQYALGTVFFELVTGRKPYAADTPAAILLKQMNDPLPSPNLYIQGLPETVEKILFKALARQPENRFANMTLFTAALVQLIQQDRTEQVTVAPPNLQESDEAVPPTVAVEHPPPQEVDIEESEIQTVVGEYEPSVTKPGEERPLTLVAGDEEIATVADVEEIKTEVFEDLKRPAGLEEGEIQTEVNVHEVQTEVFDDFRFPVSDQEGETQTVVDERPLPPPVVVQPAAKKISRRQFLKLAAGFTAGAVVLGGGAALAGLGIKNYLDSSHATQTAEVVEALKQQSATAEAKKPIPTTKPLPTKPTMPPKINTPVSQIAPRSPDQWPLGEVPRNRTLILSILQSANRQFNPFNSASNHQNGTAILYEPCAYYNIFTDKTIFWLTESYQYNEDATVCMINFRKGIRWSDGVPFTAQDVAWSMETLKRVEGLNRSDPYRDELNRVEVVNDLTLKIYLNYTDWRFFSKSLTFYLENGNYTAIQPAHIYKPIPDDRLAEAPVYDIGQGWPVSTGPYGAGESNADFTNYDLRPFWWAVETGFVRNYPDVWRMHHRTYLDDGVVTEQFVNNDIDLAGFINLSTVHNLLLKAPQISSWTGNRKPYGHVDGWPISVTFNTQIPPFDDRRVRWAIAYALDQRMIAEKYWGDASLAANSPFTAYPRLNEYMGSIQDLTAQQNVLEYDLDKSNMLMYEAGYPKGDNGFWLGRQGKPIAADLYAAMPLFDIIAPLVAEMLQQAGFNCTVQTPDDVWAAIADGRAPLFLFGHSGSVKEPLGTFLGYHKDTIAPIGEQSWGNITRWLNEDFSRITDAMWNTPPEDPRMRELFRQGMEIWYKELPDCPLVQWYNPVPFNTHYWANWPNEKNPYISVYPWSLTLLQLVLGLKATGAE
jgi:peptide/nickel transport system substrate-binding protein